MKQENSENPWAISDTLLKYENMKTKNIQLEEMYCKEIINDARETKGIEFLVIWGFRHSKVQWYKTRALTFSICHKKSTQEKHMIQLTGREGVMQNTFETFLGKSIKNKSLKALPDYNSRLETAVMPITKKADTNVRSRSRNLNIKK
jgi:hypothetical protein